MATYQVQVLENIKQVQTHQVEKKPPSTGEVLVKISACAICTLEQRFYTGKMNRYPFAGGHEVAGVIESIGDGVKTLQVGDKVAVRLLNSCGECYYCRNGNENQCVVSFIATTQACAAGPGGFAEYMTIPAKNAYRLADDIDLNHGALTEPLACCVHSIDNARIDLADDVVIIGVGIMGALHIQLAKLKGARVIACEVDEQRLEVARQMGADILIHSAKEDAVAQVKKYTDGRGADVVISTVASASVAESCCDMAGKLGRIVFYSSIHPDEPIKISPNQVHSTEKIITGAVNPKRKDFLIASKLLSQKLIDVSSLISDVFDLADIEQALEKAIQPDTYRILLKC